jgi:hypothetical protein
MIFLVSLASGAFILNLTFGVGLALSRAKRWYGLGLLTVCFIALLLLCHLP